MDSQKRFAVDGRGWPARSWWGRCSIYRCVVTSVLFWHIEVISCSDDPQMPGLIPLIRKVRPEVPVVYRSHIEIRSDLVHKEGSPQEEVWRYLWNSIQHADLFISARSFCQILNQVPTSSCVGHPVNKFVPSDVPAEKLCLLGAATDWCVQHQSESPSSADVRL